MALAQPVLSGQPALAPAPSASSQPDPSALPQPQLAPPARKTAQKATRGQANTQSSRSASFSEDKPPARGAANKKSSVSGSTTASSSGFTSTSGPTVKANNRKRLVQLRLTTAEKKKIVEEAKAQKRAEAEAKRQLANLQRDQRNPTYKPFFAVAVKDYTNSK